MAKVVVQFEDSTQQKIVAYYGSQQNPEVVKNLGEVEDDDPRFLKFLDMSPGPIGFPSYNE